ncbi:hypothetical protein AB0C87_25245 [Actinomadura sp. NPDC048021]|uniref:hypothetical protein n=1 Tax=Actinomadura sp. NPDC048021 TaxID=3155385 RepID=UPI0034065B9C
MHLTDWLGVGYGIGSTVAYCEHFRRSSSRMLVGKVVEITEKGTVIIEVEGYSRGYYYDKENSRRACQVRENITVLES